MSVGCLIELPVRLRFLVGRRVFGGQEIVVNVLPFLHGRERGELRCPHATNSKITNEATRDTSVKIKCEKHQLIHTLLPLSRFREEDGGEEGP
jgi:hypothetical protein